MKITWAKIRKTANVNSFAHCEDYISSNFPLPVYQASWNMSRIRVAPVNSAFKVESERLMSLLHKLYNRYIFVRSGRLLSILD